MKPPLQRKDREPAPTRPAAQLLREAAEADPEAHNASLARAYGVGPELPEGTRLWTVTRTWHVVQAVTVTEAIEKTSPKHLECRTHDETHAQVIDPAKMSVAVRAFVDELDQS